MTSRVEVDMIVKATSQGFEKIQGDIKGLSKETGELDPAVKKTNDSMSQLASTLKVAAVGALVGAGYAMIKFGKDSVTTAAAVQEMTSKFTTVFGPEAERAEAALSEFANTVGRAKTDLMGYAATLQDTFVPLGFARDAAADMSVQLVKLAEDVGSFNNVATPDVIRDFQSALVGNTETLRKYGVVAQETQIKQEAINTGLWDGTGMIDAQAKAQAILQLIIKGTTDAQGDALRTADEYTNVQRAAAAATTELQLTIGDGLLPTLTELSKKQREATLAINETMKAITGANAASLDALIETNIASADGVDGLIAYGRKLDEINNKGLGLYAVLGGTGQSVSGGILKTVTAMANAADSADDFSFALEQAFTGRSASAIREMLRQMGMTEEQFYEATRAAAAYAAAMAEAESFDRKFTRTQGDVADALADTADEYTNAYIEAAKLMATNDPQAYERMAGHMRRKARAAEEMAEADKLAAEAADEAAQALDNLNRATGQLFTEALNGTPIQDDLNASIIRAGQAAGLSAEKLAILAGQFGDYTDEAIEAALKSALIAQKMDELVEAFGRGDISVMELRAQLARYIEDLDGIPDAVNTDITANIHVRYPDGPMPITVPGITLPEGTELMSAGGLVGGGVRGRDSVPALLTPGEIVLPTSATTNMTAAMDFLRDYMPGQTTGTMGGGVNIESGAIVINAGPGMDSGAIADAVLNRIDRQLGQRAGARARL